MGQWRSGFPMAVLSEVIDSYRINTLLIVCLRYMRLSARVGLWFYCLGLKKKQNSETHLRIVLSEPAGRHLSGYGGTVNGFICCYNAYVTCLPCRSRADQILTVCSSSSSRPMRE